MSDKVAIGIVTYNRPEQFRTVAKAVLEQFDGIPIFAYNDGSPQTEQYSSIRKELSGSIDLVNAPVNQSVGYAKNRLLERMLDDGADWLFILEDDIIPISPDATTAYIEACKRSKWHHLMFAHHGELNKGVPLNTDWVWGISFFLHCVGAWCVYTREVIEKVGLIDEAFINAWDHVEHTWRIAQAGMTAPFWNFADVAGSDKLLAEMDLEATPIGTRSHEAYDARVAAGLQYWRAKDPNCPI